MAYATATGRVPEAGALGAQPELRKGFDQFFTLFGGFGPDAVARRHAERDRLSLGVANALGMRLASPSKD